jgi:hypothetical protein
VEGVEVRDTGLAEQVALFAPVDLRLSAGRHLEGAMQPAQPVLIAVGEFGGDPRPCLGQEDLDALVVAGEAVLGDQPLMNHGGLQRRVGTQPRLHQRIKRGDQQRLAARPPGAGLTVGRGRVLSQIPTNRAPVTAALTADLGERGARSMQGWKRRMFIQDSRSRIMSRGLRARLLGGGQPRGAPHSGLKGLNAPRPTYTSGRTENDI